MKVGLFINTQFPEGTPSPPACRRCRSRCALARDAGFASLWFPDHYLTGPLQMPQPMPLMAWLAREAEGMVIGPNIRILPLLNPVMVAEEAATHGPADAAATTCSASASATASRSSPPSACRSPNARRASSRASR